MAKRIVGVIASRRKMGNSELLTKAALIAARDLGAEISLLRLTDFRIDFCDGCMRCVFDPRIQDRTWTCGLSDDMGFLVEEILSCDGLIVASPTYALGPAAVIKNVIDRTMGLNIGLLYGQEAHGKKAGDEEGYWRMKPGAAIATAGPRGWSPFSLPVLNQLLMALGFRPVGSMVAFAPGPGQVILDPSTVEMAEGLGRAVALNRGVDLPRGHCPVCGSDFFRIISRESVECVVCGISGRIGEERGGWTLHFDSSEIPSNRWAPSRLLEHRRSWILGTRETYMRDRAAIKEARRQYEDDILKIRWVSDRRGRGETDERQPR